ncbi:unnamed protein product [Ectocarpus sp. 4 AP-2014]
MTETLLRPVSSPREAVTRHEMLLESDGRSSYSQCRGDILGTPHVQSVAEVYACRCVQGIEKSNKASLYCCPVLCVLQGEVAAASCGEGPAGLGSDSATTCHIVAFRNPASGRTCLAHLDDARKVEEAVACMLRLMSAGGDGAEEPLDLYVVGGYVGKTCSEALSNALLCVLHESPRAFRVVLACMSRLNSMRPAALTAAPTGDSVPVSQTPAAQPPSVGGGWASSAAGRINIGVAFDGGMQGRDVASEGASSARAGVGCARDPQTRQNHPVPTDPSSVKDNDTRHRDDEWLPRQTGLAIDLRSGQAYPVRFEGEGRGPGWEVRSSRVFSGSREKALTEIYQPRSDSVVVSPFPVFVDPRWLVRMLVLPDRELLAQTSTSPEAEDERFVADVRAQFSYMLAQSGADGQSWCENVFGAGGGRPLVFPRLAPTS